jgi:hypothetical protein
MRAAEIVSKLAFSWRPPSRTLVHFPVIRDNLGQPAASSGLVLLKYEAAQIFCALPSSSVGVSLQYPRCSFPIRSRPVSVPLLPASTVSAAGMSIRLHLQPQLDQTADGRPHPFAFGMLSFRLNNANGLPINAPRPAERNPNASTASTVTKSQTIPSISIMHILVSTISPRPISTNQAASLFKSSRPFGNLTETLFRRESPTSRHSTTSPIVP